MSGRAPVLVVGGAGYVGSHAARALARDGRVVVVLDDLSTGHREFVKWGELIVGADDDEDLVRATCRRHAIGAVLHFAARTRVEESITDPAGYRRANVEATGRLVRAVRAEGVRAFVFSSSAAVYGTPDRVPIPEDHPQRPTSPYGETKAEAEALLAASGLAVASLRYFNAAGAAWRDGLGEIHDPETHVIPLALEAAMTGSTFTVFGEDWNTPDGTCVRDYVHVEDLAVAHVAALARLEAGGASCAWNLGTGSGCSVNEVLGVVERVVGRAIVRRRGPRRAGDPSLLIADPSRARRDLGWAPTASSIDRIVADAWAFRGLRRGRGDRGPGAAAPPPPGGPPCAT